MSAGRVVNRLGCAAAAIVLLVGCARGGGNAAANAPAAAVNVASVAAAAPANASQSDLFPIDNAADNATNTVDPAQAVLLAQKNADCVDQLIKSQPFGETPSQVIDSVAKACLQIAQWEAQASPTPPANVAAAERSFVAGRVRDLAAEANAPPTNAAPANAAPPGPKPPPPA